MLRHLLYPFRSRREQVQWRLEQALGAMSEIDWDVLEDGTWLVVRGSAVIFLSLEACGFQEMQLHYSSPAVLGARVDPELLDYLLQANACTIFGGFTLNQEQNIVYEYSSIATRARAAEIRETIRTLAKTVDDYDNKIISKWGGETCHFALFGYDA